MVVIIILLALFGAAAATIAVLALRRLREVEGVALDLDEENKDLRLDLEMATAVCRELQVTVETQTGENYGLAMENRSLHHEMARHLFCLEMVLTEEFLP
jgi:hypothetical protein